MTEDTAVLRGDGMFEFWLNGMNSGVLRAGREVGSGDHIHHQWIWFLGF